jgi:HEAT repeat protein
MDGQNVVLNVPISEFLADVGSISLALARAFERAGPSLGKQWRVTQAFRRAGLGGELLDSLANPDSKRKIAAARLCGALRFGEAVPWLADLLGDPSPEVQNAAMRALGATGGGRAVEALIDAAEHLPCSRLAIELSRSASDIDLETLLRRPGPVQTTAAVIAACGLTGDTLRVPRLTAMAQDRRCDSKLRVAACRALSMIRDPDTAEVMRGLATDADAEVRAAAGRARVRINFARHRPR